MVTGSRSMHRVVILVLLLAACRPSVAADSERPNIVLFLVDDLGWRDLGCYGSTFYETPRVDAFARKSMRFTQAYSACHVCSPSRASMLTGKYPARLGLTDWLPGRKDFAFQKLKNVHSVQQLPLAEVTVAEVLKQHGYRTAHLGKWHLGEEPFGPSAQGFDVQIPRWNKGWPKVGYHAPFEMEGLTDSPGDYLTDRLTDEALHFIDENQKQPFFLYLSHFAVHDPIQGRDDLVKKYEAKLRGTPPVADKTPPFVLEGNPDNGDDAATPDASGLVADARYRGFRVLPDRMVKIKERQDNVQFAAMVESIDQSFGRIMTRLNELGLDQRTIVIFASDNGGMSAANFGNPQRVIGRAKLDAAYSTSNLPLRGGKGWLYEGGIRVPLIVKWPGADQAGVCDVPVIGPDFFPSILEMTGIAAGDLVFDGVSIVPLLKGAASLPREAIYWHFPHYSNHGMQSPGGAIRRGNWKLFEYFENGTVQLFDLKHDPGEQHDLAAAEPQRAGELKSMLHAWRKSVDAQMPEPNPEYSADAYPAAQ